MTADLFDDIASNGGQEVRLGRANVGTSPSLKDRFGIRRTPTILMFVDGAAW